MKLREPYQRESVEAVLEQLRTHWSTLLVLATGLGKTVVFTEVAKRWHHGRVLILAHREELVSQAAAKVQQATGERPQIEMAEQTGGGPIGDRLFGDPSVVVGSVQSVCRRLGRLDPSDFGLVIVDEAKHCVPQNRTYAAIIEHFKKNKKCRLLGVEATPDRADKLAMGQYFETVSYEMDILDGINGGWLVPIEQKYVRVTGLDFSKVRTVAGDLSESDLDVLMNEDGGRLLHEIAAGTVENSGHEPCLVFANSVGSAQAIAKIISRYPGLEAVCLHGKTDKEVRRNELRRFNAGEFQFLVGCDLFLEGFDCPRIAIISNGKPTKARNRYAQMIGRGSRTLPGTIDHLETEVERIAAIAGSAKSRCLVLDFVGNSAQHKLISTADILAGKHESAAVLEAVKQAQQSGLPFDMRGLMDAAKEHLQADADRKAAELAEADRVRREGEAEREREWLRAQAQMELEDVDPFGVDASGTTQRKGGLTVGVGVSTAQIEFLSKHGIAAEKMSKGEAGRAINDVLERIGSGQCSVKQASVLQKFGESTTASKAAAKVLIDVIAARGWKARDYRLTRERWRIKRTADGKYQPMVIDPRVGRIAISQSFKSEQQCRAWIQPLVEKAVA